VCRFSSEIEPDSVKGSNWDPDSVMHDCLMRPLQSATLSVPPILSEGRRGMMVSMKY
jgi:hypothetical protein